MEVSFEGQLSADDWGRANALHYKPSVISALSRLYVLACFTCVIVSLTTVYNGLFLGDFQGVFILFYCFLGLIISHPFWVGYWARLHYRMNKGLFAPISGKVSDEGIVICTADSKSEFKWTLYKKFKQTKGLLLLYQNRNCFNYFPRSFFATEDDWLAFNELVKSEISEK